MRFLADENVPRVAVEALRSDGHDVVWVRDAEPGSSDPAILAWASRDSRILLTFDTDFGDLARGAILAPTGGVVLVRTPPPRSAEAARRLADTLSGRHDWAGHISVIEAGRVRMRALGRPS